MLDHQLVGLITRLLAQVGINRDVAANDLDEKIADTKSEIGAIQAVKSGNLKGAGVVATDVPILGKALPKFSQNPELLLYKIKTDAYKFSWALIPISVPFVWLLFPFSRRFRLYDHTVFVTYSLCFMTLLVVVGVLLGAIGLGSITGLLFLVPPIHMYRQLKGAYALTTWGAVWRASLLTIFAMIAITLFVSLLVTIGLLD